MIFLNRTCFNGLYRENSKGGFNVSFGKYLNPNILDKSLIRTDSEILQKVEILNGDFSQIESHLSDYTFIYFDPPYRPITSSAAFTAYSKGNFNDKEQVRLKEFYTKMSDQGCHVLLSNSDGKASDSDNTYLDEQLILQAQRHSTFLRHPAMDGLSGRIKMVKRSTKFTVRITFLTSNCGPKDFSILILLFYSLIIAP